MTKKTETTTTTEQETVPAQEQTREEHRVSGTPETETVRTTTQTTTQAEDDLEDNVRGVAQTVQNADGQTVRTDMNVTQ